jgi:hypothetical protein
MEQRMRRHRTLSLFGLLIGLVAALGGAWAGPQPTALAADPANGWVDFSFPSSIGSDPTGDKPQSKLWHNDGSWWAVMFHTPSSTWHIYRLTWPSQWVDTGVVVDERPTSRADVLWDGNKLYIASLVRMSGSNQGRLYRFSYNPGGNTYIRDAGFPVVMMTGSAETLAFDKDSTGQFWITYTQGNKVWVNRSTTSDAVWGTPFVVPGAANIASDDISSLVAYRDQSGAAIGVLWANHNTPPSMYFSYHKDGDADTVWQPVETIYTAKCAADDHINLKSLQADPSGAIFAAIKTSFGDSGCGNKSSDPLIRLVVRKPNNTWSWTTFGTVADQHTRPIVLLDTTNRQVYMFATAPTSCGTIYYKKTSMDNPSFPSGRGTAFLGGTYPGGKYTCVNNVTSTKQTVDASTGLVVLASDESKRYYLHNAIDLGPQGPRLSFNWAPKNSEVGKPFDPQPVVVAQSGPGQTNTSFNGPVTLTIKSGTGSAGATLGGSVTVNAVNGVATFGGLSINKTGTSYKLTASASGMTSGDSGSFNVVKLSQSIAFNPLLDKRYGDAPFAVSAVATSGLPVSFTANGDCAVSGGTVTLTGAGVCTVTASQAGNDFYDLAQDVTQTFDIDKGNQAIAFAPLPPVGYGHRLDGLSQYASASSGLPVTFTAGGSCQISGNALVVTGHETCFVVASQTGNKNFNAALDVFQSFEPGYVMYLPLTRRS